YQSKWMTGSDEDLGATPTCPADLAPRLASEIEEIAVASWNAVGGTGYGRVDLRVDDAGRPWLLEVNPNPDISPHAGLARMARAAGMDYNGLIRRVCEAGLARQQPQSALDQWQATLRLSGVERRVAGSP
ncbi:MAG: hypothetical protein ABIS03_14120, partial [Gemmatimonadaceae bacterium]